MFVTQRSGCRHVAIASTPTGPAQTDRRGRLQAAAKHGATTRGSAEIWAPRSARDFVNGVLRGTKNPQSSMFGLSSPESNVPDRHPLRLVDGSTRRSRC